MPVFLDTRGNPTLGIGICGRCSRKMPLHELHSDPNAPGLMVCEKDLDEFDPYRLPPLQPDTIVLPFTRPDTPLNVPVEVSYPNQVWFGPNPVYYGEQEVIYG